MGVLSARVRVDLRVEHHRLDVRPVLEHHLGHVLIADIAHPAVAADHPYFRQLEDFLIGHHCVGEVDVLVGLARGDHALVARHQHVQEALGDDRPARVVDHEALAEQPSDGDPVLEERVHPRIRVGVVRRGRSVDRVAPRVGRHRHHRHPVGETSVDRLQVLVVERFLPEDRDDRVHDLLI